MGFGVAMGGGGAALPPGGVPQMGGKFGKVAAVAGAASGVLAAGVAAWTIQEMIVDHIVAKSMKVDKDNKDKRDAEAKKIGDTYERIQTEGMTEAQARTLAGERGAAAARGEITREDYTKLQAAEVGKQGESAVERFMELERSRARRDAEFEQMFKGNQALLDALNAFKNGTMKVRVENASEIRGAAGPGSEVPGRVALPVPGPGEW